MEGPLSVAVIGAGRGPLVERVLQAAEILQRNVQVFAIEKNKMAVNILLKRKAMTPSWRNVEVIACDVRELELPTKVSFPFYPLALII